jgi:uncharacterized phage protein (TIGR02216 family)
MGAGLGLLRLRPADFWAMTPRELTAALGGLTGRPCPMPMRRSDLSALIDRFPDGTSPRDWKPNA